MRETGGILPYRRNALLISLALGIATLVIVPAYNTFIADTSVLSLPGYSDRPAAIRFNSFLSPFAPISLPGNRRPPSALPWLLSLPR